MESEREFRRGAFGVFLPRLVCAGELSPFRRPRFSQDRIKFVIIFR